MSGVTHAQRVWPDHILLISALAELDTTQIECNRHIQFSFFGDMHMY